MGQHEWSARSIRRARILSAVLLRDVDDPSRDDP